MKPVRAGARKWMIAAAACAWAGATVGVSAGMAGSGARAVARAPEPDPVPRRWQLDLQLGPLRVASIPTEKTGAAVYYFATYKVVNNSGQDLLFAPSWELGTDEGRVVRSGRGVPAEVTRQLMAFVQNPLIEDQISIIGQLLQGEENAKEGVVVWAADDLDPDHVTVYGAGFSGETKTYTRPDTGDEVVLRKTFMARYFLPGTLEGRGYRPLELREPTRWIMR